jgi:hypothetical protein
MNESQLQQVALRTAMIVKRLQLEKAAQQRLKAGIEINGITLAAGEADQQAFTRLLTLLREAHELQPDAAAKAAFMNTPQVITDIHGVPHTLPGVRALRLLLVAYGAAIRDLWTLHATRRAAIRSATTREELDALPLGN